MHFLSATIITTWLCRCSHRWFSIFNRKSEITTVIFIGQRIKPSPFVEVFAEWPRRKAWKHWVPRTAANPIRRDTAYSKEIAAAERAFYFYFVSSSVHILSTHVTLNAGDTLHIGGAFSTPVSLHVSYLSLAFSRFRFASRFHYNRCHIVILRPLDDYFIFLKQVPAHFVCRSGAMPSPTPQLLFLSQISWHKWSWITRKYAQASEPACRRSGKH